MSMSPSRTSSELLLHVLRTPSATTAACPLPASPRMSIRGRSARSARRCFPSAPAFGPGSLVLADAPCRPCVPERCHRRYLTHRLRLGSWQRSVRAFSVVPAGSVPRRSLPTTVTLKRMSIYTPLPRGFPAVTLRPVATLWVAMPPPCVVSRLAMIAPPPMVAPGWTDHLCRLFMPRPVVPSTWTYRSSRCGTMTGRSTTAVGGAGAVHWTCRRFRWDLADGCRRPGLPLGPASIPVSLRKPDLGRDGVPLMLRATRPVTARCPQVIPPASSRNPAPPASLIHRPLTHRRPGRQAVVAMATVSGP